MLDVSGSERLLGGTQQIATALRQAVCAPWIRGQRGGFAQCLCGRAGGAAASQDVTAIAPGREAETLAPLPLSVLELDDEPAQTFARVGHPHPGTIGRPAHKSLVARVGQIGLRLQAQARGEYRHLLVPAEDPADAPLCESIELEHPVELLEPLLFLLSRMLEQITERAAQRSLAIASIELCLCSMRTARGDAPASIGAPRSRPEDRRTVRPALPERDHHTLLKLMQLDLEMHPPDSRRRCAAHPGAPGASADGAAWTLRGASSRGGTPGDSAGAPAQAGGRRPRRLTGAARQPRARSISRCGLRRLAEHLLAATGAPIAQCSLQPVLRSALRMVRPPRAVAIELRGERARGDALRGSSGSSLQACLRPLAHQRSLVDASCLVSRRVGRGLVTF